MKKIFALYILLLAIPCASIKSTHGSISKDRSPFRKLDKLPRSQITPVEGVDRLRSSERWREALRQEKISKITLAKEKKAAHVERLRLENELLLEQLRQLHSK